MNLENGKNRKADKITVSFMEVLSIDVLKFLVTRPDDTVLVYLMKNKSDNTYSFVNITGWHICPCRFQSIRDAVSDMDRLKEEGKIVRYEFTN